MSETPSPLSTEQALRQRVAELEGRVEQLNQALGLKRAAETPDAFRWILEEGRHGNAVRARDRFRYRAKEVPGLFSVIIPAYNANRFLTRSIESVWTQTLPAERIEIIVADDGSRDDTRALARQLAARSPVPIKIVAHPGGANRGVAATRNLACSHARGEFLALLDADDAFLPERLAAADDYFRAHPAAVALCSLGTNVDQSGKTVVGHNGTEVAGQWRGLVPDVTLEPPFTFEMLWQVDPVANSSLTIRRSAFVEVGGFPSVMAHQAEDWLLVMKLSALAPIPCLERELFLYTHHAGAYTHAYHAGNLRDGARLELFYNLVHWMLSRPGMEEEAQRFFRRNYPRVLASQHRLFPVIRDYGLRRGAGAPSAADFADYFARTFAELESLRRVVPRQLLETRRWRDEALALRQPEKKTS